MKRIPILLAALALAATATACGSDSAESSETAANVAQTTGDAADAAAAPSLRIADTDLGSVLVDADGSTVYLFTNDDGGSTCNEGCQDTWPPVLAPVSVSDGADAELIGSVTRADGTEQATYGGWPVYYYAGDAGPGDTNGQGVGDVWFVVDSRGNGIGAPTDDGYYDG